INATSGRWRTIVEPVVVVVANVEPCVSMSRRYSKKSVNRVAASRSTGPSALVMTRMPASSRTSQRHAGRAAVGSVRGIVGAPLGGIGSARLRRCLRSVPRSILTFVGTGGRPVLIGDLQGEGHRNLGGATSSGPAGRLLVGPPEIRTPK